MTRRGAHDGPDATAIAEREIRDDDLAGLTGAGPSFWTCYTPKC
jgi:hypothetical protein